MRFKICAFYQSTYAQDIDDLVFQLQTKHVNSSVSVKYINKSGVAGLLFVDVSLNGQCSQSYSDQSVDFEKLNSLAALEFELAS